MEKIENRCSNSKESSNKKLKIYEKTLKKCLKITCNSCFKNLIPSIFFLHNCKKITRNNSIDNSFENSQNFIIKISLENKEQCPKFSIEIKSDEISIFTKKTFEKILEFLKKIKGKDFFISEEFLLKNNYFSEKKQYVEFFEKEISQILSNKNYLNYIDILTSFFNTDEIYTENKSFPSTILSENNCLINAGERFYPLNENNQFLLKKNNTIDLFLNLQENE